MAFFPDSGIVRLRNPIRNYSWGSHTVIAELLGHPSPSVEPEAELWIGAHPSAPSHFYHEGADRALDEAIMRDSEALLGEAIATKFSRMLPFLVKVLAADAPLSLQVHPDEATARTGFESENRAGIPLDAPNRSYRDSRSKPELVLALTPFDALVGFREPQSAIPLIRRLGIAELDIHISHIDLSYAENSLVTLFKFIHALGPNRGRQLLNLIMERLCDLRECNPAYLWTSILSEQYPYDVCALAPLFLNLVHLEPGQVVAFQPGEVHAYLRGAAVEVTGNSDNVIRAGLTTKHIDTPEFLRRARFSCNPVKVLNPIPRNAVESAYHSGFAEFEMSLVRLNGTQTFTSERQISPQILVCIEGHGVVMPRADKKRHAFGRGATYFVSSNANSYRIVGATTLCRVCVPAINLDGLGC